MIDLLIDKAKNKVKQPFEVHRNYFDFVIVGSGIVGTAMATYLAKKGYSIAVIEKKYSEPNQFKGELLQPGGYKQLIDLGFNAALFDEIDSPKIKGYAMFHKEKAFQLPYFDFESGEKAIGRSFHYGKFVMQLRKELSKQKNVTLIEAAANDLIEDDTSRVNGIYCKGNDGKKHPIYASLVVISNGGFSKYKNILNKGKSLLRGYSAGLLLEDCSLPFKDHGHVFLDRNTPLLSYPISSNEVRLLIDFPGQIPPFKNGRHKEVFKQIESVLPKNMKVAMQQAVDKNEFKAMPCMNSASKPVQKSGVVVLGDALNMRHPLTGGGMTVGLSDVKKLSDMILLLDDLKNGVEVDKTIQTFYKERHNSIASINILADALYSVFSSSSLKKVCFEYLGTGKNAFKAPVLLLSAVSRDQKLLVKEFFKVALYGSGLFMKDAIIGKGTFMSTYNILREAITIIKPLLINENPSFSTKIIMEVAEQIFPKYTNVIKN